MREALTVDDLYSLILLLRSADQHRALILLEGDSDCAVFDPHLNQADAQTIPCHSRQAVVGVASRATSERIFAVAGVVDADFEHVTGGATGTLGASVFMTDHYDLDADLFYSEGVVERIVAAHADRKKVRDYLVRSEWKSPGDVSTHIAAEVGLLRLASHKNGCGISTRNLPLQAFVNFQWGTIEREKMVLIAYRKSGGDACEPNDLLKLIKDEEAHIFALEDVCSGHDLAAALSNLVRNQWGGTAGADQLERSLRVAADCSTFSALGPVCMLTIWGESLGLHLWHERCRGTMPACA